MSLAVNKRGGDSPPNPLKIVTTAARAVTLRKGRPRPAVEKSGDIESVSPALVASVHRPAPVTSGQSQFLFSCVQGVRLPLPDKFSCDGRRKTHGRMEGCPFDLVRGFD